MAENGLNGAQANLGYLYAHGYGVDKNPKQALYWYKKSADQNNLAASIDLVALYLSGDLGYKDFNGAILILKKLKNKGDNPNFLALLSF